MQRAVLRHNNDSSSDAKERLGSSRPGGSDSVMEVVVIVVPGKSLADLLFDTAARMAMTPCDSKSPTVIVKAVAPLSLLADWKSLHVARDAGDEIRPFASIPKSNPHRAQVLRSYLSLLMTQSWRDGLPR